MAIQNYKKFVTTAATASLVASAVVPAVQAETAKKSFTDVGDRYIDAVNYLVDNGLADGVSSTKFGTEQAIKRVDVAVMLAKATLTKEEIEKAPASGFTDVPARATKYVNALKAKGIVNGKTTTSFGSDASITRGEAAIMLANAYKVNGNVANVSFSDVAARYKEAVAALVDNQVTSGKGGNKFGTADSIKRGELAIFLYKLENLTVQEPKVESVTALNGVQLEVKFSQAVRAASLFENGEEGAFKAGVMKVSTLDGKPTGDLSGRLSADGKKVVITSENLLEGSYAVVVDQVASKDGEAFDKFESIIKVEKDVKAPTIVGTEQLNASQVKVKFSEPMQAFSAVKFAYADGKAIDAGITGTVEAGATEAIFTIAGDITASKDITATFIGAKDIAGNLISPNPATVTFQKGAKDGVAPTVSAITQKGAKQFVIKFSEEILSSPTVTVSNFNVDKVEKDTANPTQYIVTTKELLDEVQTVKVSNYTDLSGEEGNESSKLVTFVKDTVAAKVVSAKVVADTPNNKEYLELTFDKDVILAENAAVSATGKYINNFVTNTISISDKAVDYKVDTNKKVVRIALADLLAEADVKGAAYTLDFTLTGFATETGVATETATATFTRGEDGKPENTEIVKVDSIVQDKNDNSLVYVTFDKEVAGASAISTSNYEISGAAVESVTLNPVQEDGKQVAVLKLVKGSNTYTGVRNIKISNVKALGSTKTMAPYTTNEVSLKENVAPTVTSAKWTATDTIELTFSEGVVDATGLDFEVLANGKSRATVNEVNAQIGSTAKKTVEIKVNTISNEELSSGISLKALPTLDVKDTAGNVLTVPNNITVTQK